MVAAELVIAAFSVSYKLAADDGMNMKVLITYRYLFASILIFLVALFLERNKRPKLTWTILFQAFLCAIFGGPMSQNIYSKSLVLTSATFAAAFTNLIPPLTFIVAVLLRLEKVEIGKITGKAKVIGTLVGVGGAMILTFYKGQQLNIKSSHFNLLHDGQRINGRMTTTHKTSNHIVGSILALAYSLSIALYYILQSTFSTNYPCHYSNTFLFSVIGLIQSVVYAIPTERTWSQWKLSSKIWLLSAIFQGICSLLAVFLVTAAVHLQGPLFVSVFNPLVLVFVAVAGFFVLNEKLYLGTLLGSVIIITGLYMVLWGKGKEAKTLKKLTPSGISKDVNVASNVMETTFTLETVSMAPTSFSFNVDEGDKLPVNSPRKELKDQEIVEDI
ncbi:WAT1-related protein At1g25270-like [Bidens hawaiensis]|uniref:WAT1-related protein At1g25270-like n=1 Tax=Bidens hawaiensis TaxID=980011 RepID=UPI00404A8761